MAPRESLLSAVINALPIVVYAFDSAGQILLAEGSALDAMGSSAGLNVGRNVRDVFDGEPETLAYIERALQGEAHVADVTLRRNGRHYQVWYQPQVNAAGEVTRVTGLSLDITEHDAAARELRDATRWLDSMLESLPIAVFGVAPDGTLTMARGSIVPDITASRIGQPMAEVYAYVPELVAAVEAALKGEDVAFSLSDGVRYFDFLLKSRRNGPLVEGVLGAIIEVTEQRQAQAAREQSVQTTRFLAAVSHELRTPLNSILGFAELLLTQGAGPLNDRQFRYAGNVQSAGRHLLALINDLLDLTKVRAGQLAIELEPVCPPAVVRATIDRMAPVADAKGLALVAGPQTRAKARAASRRVEQILLNLVSNALKFTSPPGRVTVASAREGDEVLFTVTDTGAGIAPQHRERIFEEFFQVPDLDPEASAQGTGLGLPLSRQLARAMGGDLTVSSRAGAGTTFRLRLPVDHEAGSAPSELRVPPRRRGSGERAQPPEPGGAA